MSGVQRKIGISASRELLMPYFATLRRLHQCGAYLCRLWMGGRRMNTTTEWQRVFWSGFIAGFVLGVVLTSIIL